MVTVAEWLNGEKSEIEEVNRRHEEFNKAKTEQAQRNETIGELVVRILKEDFGNLGVSSMPFGALSDQSGNIYGVIIDPKTCYAVAAVLKKWKTKALSGAAP
jgi:hypothetical protein